MDNATLLNHAYQTLEKMQKKLKKMESSKNEPIAIIGAACRFPGKANDLNSFWNILQNGIDAIEEIPSDRWNVEQHYDQDPEIVGKMYTRHGGFIENIDQFDPDFFGISPREATSMDPQQRLLLQVCWESLENAGQSPSLTKQSQTGVFMGICSDDYLHLTMQGNALQNINAYSSQGNTRSVAVGRIANIMGLQGPNIQIDTACSSSLVAIHLACQSLRNGESKLALAGGVNLILSPFSTISRCKMRALSPDGRCKTFDASADGYSQAEGCGVVVLKCLSEAIKDKDNILAVIKGSAVKHVGHSSGLTVPSELAEEEVIRIALKNAQVAAEDVAYIEAHGTGTRLGDPIEVNALHEVFKKSHSKQNPLLIGTVKTNIGHLEAAAGVAGIIKAILILQNKQIPANLHFNNPNPHIDWDKTPIVVPTQLTPWQNSKKVLGVSSFGISGTNAHIVMEEYSAPQTSQENKRSLYPIAISAKTQENLVQLLQKYNKHLKENDNISLEDLSLSTNVGRSHFAHRFIVNAKTKDDISNALQNFTPQKESQNNKVAFLFTGQGSQYTNMGKKLYASEPAFRKALDICQQLSKKYLSTPLLDIIFATDPKVASLINQTEYTQPALFSIEYALAKLWMSWGVMPDVLIGHSVGEYAAACIANVFSVEDGFKLIAARSRLMQALPPDGMMAVVRTSQEHITKLLLPYKDKVSIAAINGEKSIVISGDIDGIEAIIEKLDEENIFSQPLQVSHAFHSPLMNPMLDEFLQVAKEIDFHSPQIDIISNLTNKVVSSNEMNAEYWVEHVREPVYFAQGIQKLQEFQIPILLETGPKPILLGMAKPMISDESVHFLPSLRQEIDDEEQIAKSLAHLYLLGIDISWQNFNYGGGKKISLPTYPWQQKRYWADMSAATTNSNINSSVMNWINKGDREKILQKMATKFTKEEQKLLPKFIDSILQLHSQKVSQQETNFYLVEWIEQALTIHPQTNAEAWVIFSNALLNIDLDLQIKESGNTPLWVFPKNTNSSENHFGVDFEDKQEIETLYTKIATDYNIAKIIYVCDAPNVTTTDINNAEKSCNTVVSLLQTLVKHNANSRLWIITQNAISLQNSHNLGFAQSALWGLGKSIALEQPHLWGGLIDVDNNNYASAITQEIYSKTLEDHIALHKNKRYVARLLQQKEVIDSSTSIDSENSYLITGGLGNIGLRMAQWLIDNNAKNIFLLGRSEASPEVQKQLYELQNRARVHILKVDISNLEEAREALAQIDPPLKGIIHAAGVARQETISEITAEFMHSVFSAKVKGAWVLHELTKEIALDFCVYFSSIASVWGSSNYAHYSAANAFLDQLAQYRRHLGLAGTSINWGPWDGKTMASSQAHELAKRNGIHTFDVNEATSLFDLFANTNYPQVALANVDWQIFKDIWQSRSPRMFLEGIETQTQSVSRESSEIKTPWLKEKLEILPSQERRDLLIAHIQKEVAKVLGRDEQSMPNISEGFFATGMDSLMAIELKNSLNVALGISLLSSAAFDHPNIKKLASYIAEDILQWNIASYQEEEKETEENSSLKEIQKLSEDELAELIDSEMDSLF